MIPAPVARPRSPRAKEISWPSINVVTGEPAATIEVPGRPPDTEQSLKEPPTGTWSKFPRHASHLWTKDQSYTNLVWKPNVQPEPIPEAIATPPRSSTDQDDSLVRIRVRSNPRGGETGQSRSVAVTPASQQHCAMPVSKQSASIGRKTFTARRCPSSPPISPRKQGKNSYKNWSDKITSCTCT